MEAIIKVLSSIGTPELVQKAVENGIWALLFVTLFIWTILENRAREKEACIREKALHEVLKIVNEKVLTVACGNSESLKITISSLEEVSDTCDTIHNKLEGINDKVKVIEADVNVIKTDVNSIHYKVEEINRGID